MFYRSKWGSFQISAIMYTIFLMDFLLVFLWGGPGIESQVKTSTLDQESVADQVDFLLWTKENPEKADKIIIGDLSSLVNFKPDLPTKILIHGYEDTGTTSWVLNVRDAYFQKEK